MGLLQNISGQSPINTWLDIWKGTHFQEMSLWNDQCELVYSLLVSLIPSNLKGKSIVETGSGSGRVSLRLAKEGADVTLIDCSTEALASSKRMFKRCKLNGTFIKADISRLPFRECIFDILWSSGVLEHFVHKQIDGIIDDSLRTVKKGGRLVVIVPNKNALVYNLSRILDMKLGRWRFGYEEPLSANDLNSFHLKPTIRRSAGFFYQIYFFSIPYVAPICHKLLKRLYLKLSKLDKTLPGYLVAGVWEN